jgi:hypothetical protein
MIHACVERFDVMCVRGNILGWEGEVNKAKVASSYRIERRTLTDSAPGRAASARKKVVSGGR